MEWLDGARACSKTHAALQVGLAYLGRTASGGYVRLQTKLPRGRGYGVEHRGYWRHSLCPWAGGRSGTRLRAKLPDSLSTSRPSDSSLFPGLALWDHRHGHVYEDLGAPPALMVVVLDPGGAVDTLAFNQLDHREVLRQLAPGIVQPLPSCARDCSRATWKLSGPRRR